MPASQDQIDSTIAALRDYIDDLGEAVDSAPDANAALTIHDQIKQANDALAALLRLRFASDDATMAAETAAFKQEADTLQKFRDSIDQDVADVAAAAKVVGALVRIATLVAAL